MNTHLQLSAFLYVSLIAVIYFQKKKINTIENIIFKSLIIHTLFTIIVDLISRVYAVYLPLSYTSEFLFKTNLWMLVCYVIIFTYYVYCISTTKTAGNVDFKENPNKKHFQKGRNIMHIFMLLVLPIIMLLPVKLNVNGIYFTQSGP